MTQKTYKIGDKFKVAANTGNYVKDTVYTVSQISGTSAMAEPGGKKLEWIAFSAVVPAEYSKEDIIAEKAALIAKMTEIDDKLAFLDEAGMDLYDDRHFKIYRVLLEIEKLPATDKLGRAKLLAEKLL